MSLNKPLRVLSLCDGISAGLMALDSLGVSCEYFAVELDKWPRIISDHNFPGRINRFENDVTKITKEQIEHLGPFDLIMFGSPCVSFSVAGNQTGLLGKSGLIVDCLKVRDWVLEFNPGAKYLIENVKMKKEFLHQMNDLIGVIPTLINSAKVSAQKRERYYWINFEVDQPEDTGENFNGILESEGVGAAWSKSTRYLDENGKKTYTKSNGGVSSYIEQRLSYDKANTLTCGKNCGSQSSYNVVISDDDTRRKLTVRECARLQKISDSFDFSIVSDTQAYKAIGNSWTVSAISHILSHGPARWFL